MKESEEKVTELTDQLDVIKRTSEKTIASKNKAERQNTEMTKQLKSTEREHGEMELKKKSLER